MNREILYFKTKKNVTNTVTRFVTDCLRKYIGLLKFIEGNAKPIFYGLQPENFFVKSKDQTLLYMHIYVYSVAV